MDEQHRVYDGSGHLHYSDGSSIDCHATLTQDHDGTLGLKYAGLRPGQSPPDEWAKDDFGGGQAQRFEGHTPEGAPIAISGTFQSAGGHWNPEAGTSREFRVISLKGDASARLEVGTRSDHGEWQFGLAQEYCLRPSQSRNLRVPSTLVSKP